MAEAAETKTAETAQTAETAETGKQVAQTTQTAQTQTTQAETKTAETKGYWPDDWQTRLSKGDEKRAKDFARYQSPEALADAYVNLRGRMDRGEFKSVLPKDPTADDMAAYRKDHGIPESPEKYDLSGVNIPESDADLVKALLKTAHDANYTPDQAKVFVNSYYGIAKASEEAREQLDEQERVAAIDALASEWGGKFSGYKNRISNFVAMLPESIRDSFMNARFPDGTALFNSPEFLKTIVAMSLKDIPDGVHVPAEGGDIGRSALDEYKAIQKDMRENRAAYNKDDGKQTRMADLIDYLLKNELIDAQGNEIVKQRKAA